MIDTHGEKIDIQTDKSLPDKGIISLLFLALFFSPLEAEAETRIALVIGNGTYVVSPLSDPPNDAELIGDTLKKLNFELLEGKAHTNIGRKKMKTLIRSFADRLKKQKDAVGLFYYSGHGMQVGGRNYMIPIGEDIRDEIDVEDKSVGVDLVMKRMAFAGNTMNFIILDACRDNPFEKSFKSTGNGLARMNAPKGSLIAFAAEPRKVARQGPGKYSFLQTPWLRKW